MYKFIVTIAVIIITIKLCNCARILGIIPSPSYSHQVVFQPLWRELSLRGHQLTVLTTDPMNDPNLVNLTEIDLSHTYKSWKMNIQKMIDNQDNSLQLISIASSAMATVIDEQLQHPEVANLINNQSEHFDLLIVECLVPTMFAFSVRFNCPFITVTSLDAPSPFYENMGNPVHPVLTPESYLPFIGELTFSERLTSVIFNVFQKILGKYLIMNKEQLKIKKYFGEDYPSIDSLGEKSSMLFVNTDPIFHPIRPLVPAIVQIGGGTHRKPAKPLPKDLQLTLDKATQGFIYFSLGTNVKSKDLPPKMLTMFLETFAELPFTILWKFELEDLPNKPKNVIISKWFPQQDIFKHPNIKLFITQGGLQSIEEAVYDYIPMVGIPFFFDQPSNIKKMAIKGMGLALDYKTMDKETLRNTILEVINNPKYRNRVEELANLAKDQPTTGLDRAVWWTEYVLRHKGAKHLRSPIIDLPFYQYYLLDVIGFCVVVLLLVSFVLFKLFSGFYKLVKYCTTSKLKTKVN